MHPTERIADYMGIKISRASENSKRKYFWRLNDEGDVDFYDPQMYRPDKCWNDLMLVTESITSDGNVVIINQNPTTCICLITGLGIEIHTENESLVDAVYEAVSIYVETKQ